MIKKDYKKSSWKTLNSTSYNIVMSNLPGPVTNLQFTNQPEDEKWTLLIIEKNKMRKKTLL